MAEARKGKQNARRLTEALRALSVEDLKKKLGEEQKKLMDERFNHVTAPQANTASLKSTRHQIARIETVIGEKLRGAAK